MTLLNMKSDSDSQENVNAPVLDLYHFQRRRAADKDSDKHSDKDPACQG